VIAAKERTLVVPKTKRGAALAKLRSPTPRPGGLIHIGHGQRHLPRREVVPFRRFLTPEIELSSHTLKSGATGEMVVVHGC
jgi:hypothetical protein